MCAAAQITRLHVNQLGAQPGECYDIFIRVFCRGLFSCWEMCRSVVIEHRWGLDVHLALAIRSGWGKKCRVWNYAWCDVRFAVTPCYHVILEVLFLKSTGGWWTTHNKIITIQKIKTLRYMSNHCNDSSFSRLYIYHLYFSSYYLI